ncbi:hypothetical protein K502DRAFT_341444 [Neoconidiobolus thromboides FSU 785]|nr:hypothetical protein K502DRAFT_341444 [Neoconidiobolus thromboides FSU 785]
MFPTFRRLLQSTIKMTKDRLKDLNFSSSFLEELPYDKVCLSYTNPNARDLKVNKKEHLDQLNKVKKEFKTGSYSLVAPESMPFPKLLHYSESCLEELDLDKDTPLKDPDFLKYVTGNETLPSKFK